MYPFRFSGYGKKGTDGLFSAFKALAAFDAMMKDEKDKSKKQNELRYPSMQQALTEITYQIFALARTQRQRREGKQEWQSSSWSEFRIQV
jgi:hypothetical protein